MSTQVTYKTNHISLLCDSTILSLLKFYFLCILLKSKKMMSEKNTKCLYMKSVLFRFVAS